MILRRQPTAPTSKVLPSMIIASSVVSPSSSGLPPKPTVPSHCNSSHRVQPSSTALSAEPPSDNTCQPFTFASSKFQVLISTGSYEAIKSEKLNVASLFYADSQTAAVWSRRREPTLSAAAAIGEQASRQRFKTKPQSQSSKFRLKLFWTFCAKLAKLGFPIFFASRLALPPISEFLIYMYGLYYT